MFSEQNGSRPDRCQDPTRLSTSKEDIDLDEHADHFTRYRFTNVGASYSEHTLLSSGTLVTIERYTAATQGQPFSPIDLVICVGRISRTQKQEVVDKLEQNNQKLYGKFQKRYHAALHQCDPKDCPAEFKSIVINGCSSNTDISTSRAQFMMDLRKHLMEHKARFVIQQCTAVIVFTGKDGLFTNVEGFRNLFSLHRGTQITFCMYKGDPDGHEFDHYSLDEMLSTIAACEARNPPDTPCYQLMKDWVRVSLNKEIIAHAQRDNRA